MSQRFKKLGNFPVIYVYYVLLFSTTKWHNIDSEQLVAVCRPRCCWWAMSAFSNICCGHALDCRHHWI